jgi:hypothetical protein
VIDDRMFDDTVWPCRVPQTAQVAWLAYRRQRRRRILRDAVTVPLSCLWQTLREIGPGAILSAGINLLLGLPVWFPCVLLFLATVAVEVHHTSQQ